MPQFIYHALNSLRRDASQDAYVSKYSVGRTGASTAAAGDGDTESTLLDLPEPRLAPLHAFKRRFYEIADHVAITSVWATLAWQYMNMIGIGMEEHPYNASSVLEESFSIGDYRIVLAMTLIPFVDNFLSEIMKFWIVSRDGANSYTPTWCFCGDPGTDKSKPNYFKYFKESASLALKFYMGSVGWMIGYLNTHDRFAVSEKNNYVIEGASAGLGNGLFLVLFCLIPYGYKKLKQSNYCLSPYSAGPIDNDEDEDHENSGYQALRLFLGGTLEGIVFATSDLAGKEIVKGDETSHALIFLASAVAGITCSLAFCLGYALPPQKTKEDQLSSPAAQTHMGV